MSRLGVLEANEHALVEIEVSEEELLRFKDYVESFPESDEQKALLTFLFSLYAAIGM